MSMPAARGALAAGVVAFPVGSHPLRQSRPPPPRKARLHTCMSKIRAAGWNGIHEDPQRSPPQLLWGASTCVQVPVRKPCQQSTEQCLSETIPHRPHRFAWFCVDPWIMRAISSGCANSLSPSNSNGSRVCLRGTSLPADAPGRVTGGGRRLTLAGR